MKKLKKLIFLIFIGILIIGNTYADEEIVVVEENLKEAVEEVISEDNYELLDICEERFNGDNFDEIKEECDNDIVKTYACNDGDKYDKLHRFFTKRPDKKIYGNNKTYNDCLNFIDYNQVCEDLKAKAEKLNETSGGKYDFFFINENVTKKYCDRFIVNLKASNATEFKYNTESLERVLSIYRDFEKVGTDRKKYTLYLLINNNGELTEDLQYRIYQSTWLQEGFTACTNRHCKGKDEAGSGSYLISDAFKNYLRSIGQEYTQLSDYTNDGYWYIISYKQYHVMGKFEELKEDEEIIDYNELEEEQNTEISVLQNIVKYFKTGVNCNNGVKNNLNYEKECDVYSWELKCDNFGNIVADENSFNLIKHISINELIETELGGEYSSEKIAQLYEYAGFSTGIVKRDGKDYSVTDYYYRLKACNNKSKEAYVLNFNAGFTCKNKVVVSETNTCTGTIQEGTTNNFVYADGVSKLAIKYTFGISGGTKQVQNADGSITNIPLTEYNLGKVTNIRDLSGEVKDENRNNALIFTPYENDIVIKKNGSNENCKNVSTNNYECTIGYVSSAVPVTKKCGGDNKANIEFTLGGIKYKTRAAYDFKRLYIGNLVMADNSDNLNILTNGTTGLKKFKINPLFDNSELESQGLETSDIKIELDASEIRALDEKNGNAPLIVLQDNITITGGDFEAEIKSSYGNINNIKPCILAKPDITYSIKVRDNKYTIKHKLTPSVENDNYEALKLCGEEFKGIKILGNLQGIGKIEISGLDTNATDLSQSSMRDQIRKNALTFVNSAGEIPETGKLINNVLVYNGSQKLSDIMEKHNLNLVETIVINNGNLIIDTDLDNTNLDNIIGIIVLSNKAYNVLDEITRGNVYVTKDVQTIYAAIYADGGLISGYININGEGEPYSINNENRVNDLNKQLYLKGSLFTRNTIGGSSLVGRLDYTNTYILPGGQTTTNEELAVKYDLNALRTGNNNIVTAYDNYFVIEYDPSLQSNPPKLFTIN